MKSHVLRLPIVFLGFAIYLSIFSIALRPTHSSATSQPSPLPDLQQVIVKVNEKGFFDHADQLFGPKNPLVLRKGKKAEITFVFHEGVTSLAIGDVHQMALTAKKDRWTIESEKIWVFNRKATLTFQPGEQGRDEYRVYCIIDCIGMDHLKNLVIRVEG